MKKKKQKPKPDVLLCALVDETERPAVRSIIDACFQCERQVWRARYAPSAKAVRPICRICLLLAVQFTGETIALVPPRVRH